MKRASIPLYLHITVLAVALVVAAGVAMRWFADAIPWVWEFALLVAITALLALVASRRIAAPSSIATGATP